MESVGRSRLAMAFAASLNAAFLSFSETRDPALALASTSDMVFSIVRARRNSILRRSQKWFWSGMLRSRSVLALQLQGHVALQLLEQALLQLREGALPIKQVAHEKQRQRAKSEKGHAHRPLTALRMDEHQGVHERGQPARQDQHEHRGKNGQLQVAAFQAVQFFTVKCGHGHSTYHWQPTPHVRGSLRSPGYTGRVSFANSSRNGPEVLW